MINFFQAWVLLLMYMKLSGHIDWSWWWVWSPAFLQIFLIAVAKWIGRQVQKIELKQAMEKATKEEKMRAFKKP
jgi:hypothetical protein